MFLEMLGNDNRLALQESFTGTSELDRAAYQYLRHCRPDFFADEFRKIVGNDETVWEAAGIEIPTISLSRFPFPEYHSSMDTEDIILESCLEDAVEAVLGIVHILETNCTMRRKFEGLVALSHPRYNLYIDQADPSIRPTVPAEQRKWNYLMDCLPRYFDGQMTVLDIAERHELPYDKVYAYIRRFEEVGLVEMLS
jgi:aminopeptidase-like protein